MAMLQDISTCSVSQAVVWQCRHLTSWSNLQAVQSVQTRLSYPAVLPGTPSLRICVHTVSPWWMPTVPTGTSAIPVPTSALIPNPVPWTCHCFSRSRPLSCTLTRWIQATTHSTLSTSHTATFACWTTDTYEWSRRLTRPPTLTPVSHFTSLTLHVCVAILDGN